MTNRTRKLAGTIILISLLPLYALVAAIVAYPVLAGAGWLAQFAFYLIAGLAWTLPAGLLVRWMQKPDV